MISPPIPADETARQARLASLEVLDSESEPTFDNITRLAAQVTGAPMALISLIDDHRQWFKAKVGLTRSETPREQSFCGHALEAQEPFVIRDAQVDARFYDNPAVLGAPNIRFYAGIPLRVGEGSALGTLCVLDRVPRELTGEQLAALRMLAEQVTTELRLRAELRRSARVALAAPVVLPGPADPTILTPVGPTGFSSIPAAASTDPDLPVVTGERLEERYQIEEAIGRGGMGFVFAATDLREERPVAIKFLRADPQRRNDAVVRFAREARIVMGMQSERVVRVYDVGNTEDGVPYIVMERLRGAELNAVMGRGGALDPARAVKIARQACEVLGEAHDAGVVHRDIKPSNLFLEEPEDETGPRLKVLDFGIAKFAPHAARDVDIAATGAFILGTPHYMAPEQIMNEGDIDGRADIWSLGVVLYEMLARKLPFPGESAHIVCQGVLFGAPLDLGDEVKTLPAGLGAIVARCLEKERDLRYPNVWALARDLALIAI